MKAIVSLLTVLALLASSAILKADHHHGGKLHDNLKGLERTLGVWEGSNFTSVRTASVSGHAIVSETYSMVGDKKISVFHSVASLNPETKRVEEHGILFDGTKVTSILISMNKEEEVWHIRTVKSDGVIEQSVQRVKFDKDKVILETTNIVSNGEPKPDVRIEMTRSE